MQVPALDTAQLAALPTVSGVPARVMAGNLATVPLGALLQATVTTVTPRDATLLVNGQTLTIRPPPGVQLQPGAVLLVRVPPNAPSAANPTLELGVPNALTSPLVGQPGQPGPPSPGTAPRVPPGIATLAPNTPDTVGRAAGTTVTVPPTARAGTDAKVLATPVTPRLSVVDVLNPLPDGRMRVQIDGEEQIATATQPLVPGGRYVLQVERTPAGVTLRPPPPDSPNLPTEVATAILRNPAPALPAALEPLQAELTTLTALTTPQPGNASQPVPAAVRAAASAVQDTLRTFLPADARPPDARQLQQLIENGGLHYESKLARIVEPDTAPARSTAQQTDTPSASRTERTASELPTPSHPTTHELPADLKGDLLRLLQTVQDLGGATQTPAAQNALNGIEAQQAANTLAQANATPYFLQIPFPDGGELKTLALSLEPQNQPEQPDAERAGRFRMFMHVPLSDLGETWIDAGLAGDKFRATIYLDRAAVRDRVWTALPELQNELQNDGFAEVLLDVRSSSELPARHRREAGALQAGRPDTVSVLDVRV